VARQLIACPAANGQQCAGNGVREALLVIIGVRSYSFGMFSNTGLQ